MIKISFFGADQKPSRHWNLEEKRSCVISLSSSFSWRSAVFLFIIIYHTFVGPFRRRLLQTRKYRNHILRLYIRKVLQASCPKPWLLTATPVWGLGRLTWWLKVITYYEVIIFLRSNCWGVPSRNWNRSLQISKACANLCQ